LKKPNYTIETLFHLRKKYPKDEFSLILGADNFKKIHLWKSYKSILDSYPIFIFPRKGSSLKDLDLNFPGSRINMITMQRIPISSSLIRDNILSEEFTYYLNPKVREYILENKLY
jgi:nicotinate-nucleotide adenylyltransferase